MLAANRTDSVIGRMKFLTSSIKTIRGIKAPGVPEGTKCDKIFLGLLRKANFNKYSNSNSYTYT